LYIRREPRVSGPAVLAVDGGNSKTEVALVDGAGDLLGAARGPGTSHHHLGVPAAMEALEALVVAACRDAGIPADRRTLAEVGELSGDWGGGHDVGVAAVGAALRGEDGRGPETTLTRAVAGWFGLGSALAVVEALFCGRIDRRRVLELVPLVFAEAEAGDQVA